MKRKGSKKTITSSKSDAVLVGFITPVEWDAQNKIKEISLLTVDQEEIKIVHDAKADRLFSLIWEKVELTGQLQTDRTGNKKIKVQHYAPADYDALSANQDVTEESIGPSDELKEVLSNNSWFSGFDEAEITRNL